jgi:hypothetical protein
MRSLQIALVGLLALGEAAADTKIDYKSHDRVPIIANKVRQVHRSPVELGRVKSQLAPSSP